MCVCIYTPICIKQTYISYLTFIWLRQISVIFFLNFNCVIVFVTQNNKKDDYPYLSYQATHVISNYFAHLSKRTKQLSEN